MGNNLGSWNLPSAALFQTTVIKSLEGMFLKWRFSVICDGRKWSSFWNTSASVWNPFGLGATTESWSFCVQVQGGGDDGGLTFPLCLVGVPQEPLLWRGGGSEAESEQGWIPQGVGCRALPPAWGSSVAPCLRSLHCPASPSSCPALLTNSPAEAVSCDQSLVLSALIEMHLIRWLQSMVFVKK